MAFLVYFGVGLFVCVTRKCRGGGEGGGLGRSEVLMA